MTPLHRNLPHLPCEYTGVLFIPSVDASLASHRGRGEGVRRRPPSEYGGVVGQRVCHRYVTAEGCVVRAHRRVPLRLSAVSVGDALRRRFLSGPEVVPLTSRDASPCV